MAGTWSNGNVDFSTEALAPKFAAVVQLVDTNGNLITPTAGYAEDSAHASADVGTPMLGVRNDAAAARSGTDGDYTMPATDSVGRLITKQQSQTATNTNVADNAASVTLLAANNSRLGASITNDSSARLYINLKGDAASITNYTVSLGQHGYYEVPSGFTGLITGIWASDPNDGAARITELT